MRAGGGKAFWLSFFLTMAVVMPLMGLFAFWSVRQNRQADPAGTAQSGIPVSAGDRTLLAAVLVWMCLLLWLGRYVVYTKDHRYVKILEIEPINFMLRSSEEQFGIISSFASWLKISPMRLQFKSITRKADSDKHVAMVSKELENEENEQCKHLGEG